MNEEIIISFGLMLILILYALFFMRNMKPYQYTHRLFMAILAFSVLASVFNFLSKLKALPIPRLVSLGLSLQMYLIVYFLLFLFFEFSGDLRPNYILMFVNAGLFSLAFTLTFVLMIDSSSVKGIIDFMYDTSYSGLGMSVFAEITYYLYKIYDATREKAALVQSLTASLVSFGFFIGLLNAGYIKDALGIQVNLLIYADAVKMIGIMFFMIFYVINPVYLKRVPLVTQALLIFDLNGQKIASFELETHGFKQEERKPPELTSALTRAIMVYMREVIGAKENIVGVIAKDRVVMLESKTVILAFIVQRETKFLRKGLIALREKIEENLAPLQRDYGLNSELIDVQKIKRIIEEEFPYIKIVSVE